MYTHTHTHTVCATCARARARALGRCRGCSRLLLLQARACVAAGAKEGGQHVECRGTSRGPVVVRVGRQLPVGRSWAAYQARPRRKATCALAGCLAELGRPWPRVAFASGMCLPPAGEQVLCVRTCTCFGTASGSRMTAIVRPQCGAPLVQYSIRMCCARARVSICRQVIHFMPAFRAF